MSYYVIELRDSDGNDCTVYDMLIEAESKDAALVKVDAYIAEEYPDDEDDGGEGTLHPCDCACEHRKKSVCDRCADMWECSHGGLLVDSENVEEYATEAEARAALRRYHSTIDLVEA